MRVQTDSDGLNGRRSEVDGPAQLPTADHRLLLQRIAAAIRATLSHPVFIVALVAALIGLLVFALDNHGAPPIWSDGWGYYLYLPAIFIHGDIHLTFLNALDAAPELLLHRYDGIHWQGLTAIGDGYVDKYAFGPAVMQLPFFLVALAVTSLFDSDVSGFEPGFHAGAVLAGAFYFALGIYLAYRAARLRYGPRASALAAAFSVLATNIYYYGTGDAAYSHISGFCLLAGLVFISLRQADRGEAPSWRNFALFGVLIGLAVMVRPTNAVAALLFLIFIRHCNIRRLLAGGLLAFACSAVAASPQMVWWWATTGSPIFYSYTGEGFSFLEPQFWNYLVSIRKGLFFWHPAYLWMILVVFFAIRRRPFEAGIFSLILIANIWIGASWSDVTFGGSFGSRQTVEMNALLIPYMAGHITWLLESRRRAWIGGALAALLIVINLAYLRGYVVGGIPSNGATIEDIRRFWSPFE